MRGLWKLTLIELKIFYRDPAALIFTIGLPLMLLFLFGGISGNAPRESLGGFGQLDIAVPGYVGWVIATAGLLSLTGALAMNRENGILRRLKVTPLQPTTILAAHVLGQFFVTTLGLVLLLLSGRMALGVRFAGDPLSFVVAYLLGSLSFFSLSFVLASLVPTARSAQRIALLLYFPMLFLSGAALPVEGLPPGVREYIWVFPLTHVVALLRGVWVGQALADQLASVGVLAGMLVVGILITAKTFRWE